MRTVYLPIGIMTVETSLRDNAKNVIAEHGISPTLLLGSLPVTVTDVAKNGRQANVLPMLSLPSLTLGTL